MAQLSDYLGFFEAAPSTTASQSGLTTMDIKLLQGLLNQLGERLPVPLDGKFGPNTKAAWQRQATKYKQNPAFDRAGPTWAWVAVPTYTALTAAAYPVQQQQAPAPAPAPASSLVQQSVKDMQKLLRALGWSKLVVDNMYGRNTAGAWETSAKSRNLPKEFVRVSGAVVAVHPSTLAAFQADAQKRGAQQKDQPTVKAFAPSVPTVTPKAGSVVKSVDELQALLYGVGWTSKKLTRDGTYGPQTRKAWQVSAGLRKLPNLFERVDGKTAQVAESTYNKIKADGGGVVAPVPKPTPTPTPSPKPGPVVVPGGDAVSKNMLELQKLLRALGWRVTTVKFDNTFGPKSQGAWESSAKRRGVNPLFARVDKNTASVSAATYARFLQDAKPGDKPSKPSNGDKPAPAPKNGVTAEGLIGTYKPGATFTVTVAENPSTGYSYEPVTSDVVALVGEKFASDCPPGNTGITGCGGRNTFTFRALKTGTFKLGNKPPGRGVATEFRTYQIKVSANAKPSDGAVTGVLVSVADMQTILIALGVPKNKNTTDGKFGPTTQKAWEAQAVARGLDAGVTGKLGERKVTVNSATYDTLLAAAKKSPAPEPAPTPGETAKITAEAVQVGLNTLAKAKLKVDNTWGPNTEKALKAWLAKQPGGQRAKFKVISTKKSASVIELSKAFAETLAAAAQKSPKPTPTPQNTKEQAEVGKLVSMSTVPTSVLSLQHVLSLVMPITFSGIWDDTTAEGFLVTFMPKGPPELHRLYRMSFPKLVSSDNRSIMLLAQYAASVQQGEEKWRARGAPQPMPDQPPPVINGGPIGPGPAPVPDGPVGPGPGPGPEPAPPPDVTPAPSPDGPAPTPAGADTWEAMVSALTSFTQNGAKIGTAVEAAKSSGQTLTPEAKEAYESWLTAADRMKARMADLIEKSPELRSAIDASASSVGLSGYSELDAFLGDVTSASGKVVEMLRTPFASAAAPPGAAMQGWSLENWDLGQGIPPQAVGWVARLTEPLWAKFVQLLGTRAVAAAGAGAAVGYYGSDAVSKAVNGESQLYFDREKALDQMVADGNLTVEQANQRRGEKPTQGSIIGPVVAGVVALGGLYLYLKNRSKRPGGQHARTQ